MNFNHGILSGTFGSSPCSCQLRREIWICFGDSCEYKDPLILLIYWQCKYIPNLSVSEYLIRSDYAASKVGR